MSRCRRGGANDTGPPQRCRKERLWTMPARFAPRSADPGWTSMSSVRKVGPASCSSGKPGGSKHPRTSPAAWVKKPPLPLHRQVGPRDGVRKVGRCPCTRHRILHGCNCGRHGCRRDCLLPRWHRSRLGLRCPRPAPPFRPPPSPPGCASGSIAAVDRRIAPRRSGAPPLRRAGARISPSCPAPWPPTSGTSGWRCRPRQPRWCGRGR